MKAWNFKAKNKPEELGRKLESALESIDGFVFSMDQNKNGSITFKMRKRILYAWYWIFINSIVVNGELFTSDTENETDVEISFTRHFLVSIIIYTHLLLGIGMLLVIFTGVMINPALSFVGVIFLTIGIVLWIGSERKFEKDIQKYKTLISEIFSSHAQVK